MEVTKKQYGDYHKLKCCPVQGCLTVTLKLSAHLKGLHKMKVDSEYYDLLKNARIYTPFTKDSMKRIRESHKREDTRKMFKHNLKRDDKVDIQFNVEKDIVLCSESELPDTEDVSSSSGHASKSESSTEAVMAKFLSYLLSVDGGKRERKSSVQVVTEVRTVVSVLDGKVENLLERYEVRDRFFKNYLDVRRKPGTSKHYIGSLISFMDFVLSEDLQFSGYTKDDILSMKLRLYSWRKVYNNLIDDQKWVNEEEDREVLVTPEQISIFERGEFSRKAIKLFGQADNSTSYNTTHLEYTNMRDFLLTIIALANAHRSGVAANMTIKEFRNATFDATSGNALIRVMNHKTRRKHGPAVVCLPQQKYRFLEIFVDNVRPQIGSDLQNVFLTWKGNNLESGAVSKQINSTWKRSGVYGDNEPPKKNLCTTVIRKSVTTLVQDNQVQDEQPLADLLAHDLTTAKKYYRMRDRERQAIKGSRAIEQVFHPAKLPEASSAIGEATPLRLRKTWAEQEEKEVRSAFEEEISQKQISMDNVRQKLPILNLAKDEKQVYDKVRALIKIDTKANQEAQVLPEEEETLSDKIGRLDRCFNTDNVNVAESNQLSVVTEDNESIITSSSQLFRKQKLFNTAESKELQRSCKDIIISGSISSSRIHSALLKTALGREILEKHKMFQIQSRLKYERRVLRLKC